MPETENKLRLASARFKEMKGEQRIRSMAALAEKAGVNYDALVKQIGRNKIQPDTAKKISARFGYSLEYVLEGTGEKFSTHSSPADVDERSQSISAQEGGARSMPIEQWQIDAAVDFADGFANKLSGIAPGIDLEQLKKNAIHDFLGVLYKHARR